MNLVIALDGPSGSGKSTVSIRLASHFNIPCLDTGAMYRSVALKALQKKIQLDSEIEIGKIAENLEFRFKLSADRASVEIEVAEGGEAYQKLGKEIRTPEVSLAASAIARLGNVREVLVEKQRKIGNQEGAVVEGRDAGTVIFPKASIKFFVTASAEERAKRRYQELKDKLGDQAQKYEDVLKEMIQRDKQDRERDIAPLKPAPDAIVVDTTGLDLEKVVQRLIETVNECLKLSASH
jgi:cytidylate kinase